MKFSPPSHNDLNSDLRKAIAAAQGINVQDAPHITNLYHDKIFPVSASVLQERKILKKAQPGDVIIGHGIYIGLWRPQDREEEGSLKKIFHVFAAPQDLRDAHGQDTFSYHRTVTLVSQIKEWKGFNGSDYADEAALYAALRNNTYSGTWIIPPAEILGGLNGKYEMVCDNTLYSNREKPALRGSFSLIDQRSSNDSPYYYWSSTPPHDRQGRILSLSMISGNFDFFLQNSMAASCRLIRLVEASP